MTNYRTDSSFSPRRCVWRQEENRCVDAADYCWAESNQCGRHKVTVEGKQVPICKKIQKCDQVRVEAAGEPPLRPGTCRGRGAAFTTSTSTITITTPVAPN